MLNFLEAENGFIDLAQKPGTGLSEQWTLLPNQVKLRLLDTGVLEVKGAQASEKDYVISCGVHGNETAPIEIVSRLINQIVTGNLEPKVNLLFILGHPVAMAAGERFISINMNRLFAGAHKNYPRSQENQYELTRAARLETLVEDFFSSRPQNRKIHFDLHTAIKPSYHKTFAIRPFTQTGISNDSRKLLLAMGIEAVLQHNKPSTTFSYYSVERFAAEAYTLELGKVKKFGENNPQDFRSAIDSLEAIIENRALKPTDPRELVEYKVVAEIVRHSDEFKFYVADDIPNFTAFPQGSLIAEDVDFNYRVAHQEESVVFPNTKVPNGQRVAVMVTRSDPER